MLLLGVVAHLVKDGAWAGNVREREVFVLAHDRTAVGHAAEGLSALENEVRDIRGGVQEVVESSAGLIPVE
jgi:hypothetical protein